jgi:hypothetical protein
LVSAEVAQDDDTGARIAIPPRSALRQYSRFLPIDVLAGAAPAFVTRERNPLRDDEFVKIGHQGILQQNV